MLGVCYYPEHWPEAWWAQDAQRMRELGISYSCASANLPGRAMSHGAASFDWGWLDRAMDVLAKAGLEDRARHADRHAAQVAGR